MSKLPPESAPSTEKIYGDEIPEGILRARAALRRNPPALLAQRRARGKWVAFGVDGQIAIGTDYTALLRECVNRRGIPVDEFIIERVEPGAGNEEEEEIDSFGV